MKNTKGATFESDGKSEADAPAYDPGRMFDAVKLNLDLKTDLELARLLEIKAPVISNTRRGKLAVGAAMFIRLHDISGLSIRDLRFLMGDRRKKFRGSDLEFNASGARRRASSDNSVASKS